MLSAFSTTLHAPRSISPDGPNLCPNLSPLTGLIFPLARDLARLQRVWGGIGTSGGGIEILEGGIERLGGGIGRVWCRIRVSGNANERLEDGIRRLGVGSRSQGVEMRGLRVGLKSWRVGLRGFGVGLGRQGVELRRLMGGIGWLGGRGIERSEPFPARCISPWDRRFEIASVCIHGLKQDCPQKELPCA